MKTKELLGNVIRSKGGCPLPDCQDKMSPCPVYSVCRVYDYVPADVPCLPVYQEAVEQYKKRYGKMALFQVLI